MEAHDVAEAVVDWVRGLIPEIKSGVPYPGAVTLELPDVWAVVQTIRTVPSDQENFPGLALEQVWLKEWFLEVSIMVEQGKEDGAAEVTHTTLERFAETLIGSTLAGATVGDTVAISPRIEANLGEPFGDRGDGTRGREVVLNLVVAEGVESPV